MVDVQFMPCHAIRCSQPACTSAACFSSFLAMASICFSFLHHHPPLPPRAFRLSSPFHRHSSFLPPPPPPSSFFSHPSTSRLPPISSFFKLASSPKLPQVVAAGDPVLHEPASLVPVQDIPTQRIQKIIDDMISVMRSAPGVGLAAPQIGIPLQIIVLEDTREYIRYVTKEEADFQQRSPFELLVICNPKITRKGNRSARFFEGCLSVQGYRGLVERHLEVEVSGFGRDGLPIKVDACGWKARILQHECDHLEGVLYVDKMVPRTFRTTDNLKLVLPTGCPKLGVYENGAN